MNNVTAKLVQLTGGNTLVDQTIGQTADNVTSINEQFPGQFRINMAVCAAFTFRVSMFGFPVGNGIPISRTEGANKTAYLGDMVFTVNPMAESESESVTAAERTEPRVAPAADGAREQQQ